MFKLFRKAQAPQEIEEFPHSVATFELPKDGTVQYARWLHPKEKSKDIEQSMVDALREFVKPGDLVIDIGAHTGDTTVPMGLAVGPEGCCLGLEPNPYVYKILEVNAGLNEGKVNIVPLNYAATEEDGSFTFNYSDAAFCNGGFLSTIKNKRHGHRFELEVKGRNLEHILRTEYADRLDRFSYIKIDTEGYDRFIIASLRNILSECRPVIRAEVLKKLTLEEREALFAEFENLGYTCYLYDEDSFGKGEVITKDKLMNWKQFDILAMPG